MQKQHEKWWPTACQLIFPSKGLLSFPGDMLPGSINNFQATGNSNPTSILIRKDPTKLLCFHFSPIMEYPDGPNIYLQTFFLSKNESFASPGLVNRTVAGVLGKQLKCQRIP